MGELLAIAVNRSAVLSAIIPELERGSLSAAPLDVELFFPSVPLTSSPS
jgi:hypothetical protein